MPDIQGVSIRLESICLGEPLPGPLSLDLKAGDICEIQSDAPEKIRYFLKFLATLLRPVSGRYWLDDRALDFSAYQSLLPVKRRIAYMTTDAALITNRSLQENILMGKAWHRNTMHPEMSPLCRELCAAFCLEEKLHLRPAALGIMGQRAVVAVRGLAKEPGLIIVERPEDFVGRGRKHILVQALKACSEQGASIIFWTDDAAIGKGWTTRKWLLEGDSFREVGPDGRE
ncbi:hypothetical protein OOT00_08245 [Desulfobotulus sp. H1]|uniref:ATP-binding cassette domain-containing protein n=1 Tax=Desulfobotulus pelophilus TaxID=2823377 RepID=A0ABT3N952_9BACT|nr:hypothetical protein [Desulfobotulus pelophilus]MCW7753974.1 hypothetical protein [Desulfobotulus pelophilus]